jgi:hypothetical protein
MSDEALSQPTYPRLATIEDKERRLAIPKDMVAGWFADGARDGRVYCVPLLWRRQLPIEPGHELEAWYVWSRHDSTLNWITDPSAVLNSDGEAGNEFYLKGLMHPATLSVSSGKCRLSCANLFDELMKRTTSSRLWLVQERTSVSILTDIAYQTGCGRLSL